MLGVADRALLDELGRAVARQGRGAARSALVDAAFARGYDLAQLAHAFLGHLRDLVVAGAVEDPSALIDASPRSWRRCVAAAQSVPAGLPELLFDRFAKVAEEVVEVAACRATCSRSAWSS